MAAFRDPLAGFVPDALVLVALDNALSRGWPDAAVSDLTRDILHASGIADGTVPAPAFAALLGDGRADLVARVRFLRMALGDLALGFDALTGDLPTFMDRAQTFGLFRYDKAMSDTAAARAEVRPWVDYVSALTRLEAAHLVPRLPGNAGPDWLEIGGNSGAFAAAICAARADVRITVSDLPAVCGLGQEMQKGQDRIRFQPRDARKSGWAAELGARDLLLFKSVLHDWPDHHARAFLTEAVACLEPGGRIVICERGPFAAGLADASFLSRLANAVFAPFYRDPSVYEGWLRAAGFAPTRQTVQLDMPFHVIEAVRA
ncbi:methyltransferase [Oceanomicrobium pacificus]|uniref:Methyltransferase domain-containing protein n=1 Tax=Oceanomicrobium pacificus TaxID=2692916 RepID=A0A6B0TRU4_9RHOB|nr:methyltransferase [Oceanomicrobium pacificus]MXU66696.1 methyltransferase domain-containing protein [Oceanomicrobium pacificus]